MNKIIFYIIVCAFIAVVFYSGCKDSITIDDLDQRVIPDSNVSFNAHIAPVFQVKCAIAECHDDGTRAGGLSLTSAVNTTADPGVVLPGYPDDSRLVWTIDPKFAYANPMPPIGYPVLTPNQIKGVRTWILEGARSN